MTFDLKIYLIQLAPGGAIMMIVYESVYEALSDYFD